MANIHDELIQNIIELSNGSVEDQLKACKKLSKIVKNIDAGKSEKLLPILIKFMSSSNCRLQKNAVTLMATIMKIQENIQIFIASDVVSKLVELLSSSEDQNILKECLNCLLIISNYFPVEMVKINAIAPLFNCLKSKIIPQISLKAASVIKNISKNKENVPAIVENGCLQFLVNLLNSKNIDLIKEAIIILTNIVAFDENLCQQILNFGILDQLKNNFNNSKLKFVSLQFIYGILYSEEQIDEIIDKCIILSILKVLSSRDGPEVKNIAVNIIQTVIEKKPLYCSTLIENDILELISDQLESDYIQLQISSLTTLKCIIERNRNSTINEKLKQQLQNLRNNGNDKIKNISTEILNKIMENNVQHEVAEINVKAEIKTEKEVDEQHYQIHPDEINADEFKRSRSNNSIKGIIREHGELEQQEVRKFKKEKRDLSPNLIYSPLPTPSSSNDYQDMAGPSAKRQRIDSAIFNDQNTPSTSNQNNITSHTTAIMDENTAASQNHGTSSESILQQLQQQPYMTPSLAHIKRDNRSSPTTQGTLKTEIPTIPSNDPYIVQLKLPIIVDSQILTYPSESASEISHAERTHTTVSSPISQQSGSISTTVDIQNVPEKRITRLMNNPIINEQNSENLSNLPTSRKRTNPQRMCSRRIATRPSSSSSVPSVSVPPASSIPSSPVQQPATSKINIALETIGKAQERHREYNQKYIKKRDPHRYSNTQTEKDKMQDRRSYLQKAYPDDPETQTIVQKMHNLSTLNSIIYQQTKMKNRLSKAEKAVLQQKNDLRKYAKIEEGKNINFKMLQKYCELSPEHQTYLLTQLNKIKDYKQNQTFANISKENRWIQLLADEEAFYNVFYKINGEEESENEDDGEEC